MLTVMYDLHADPQTLALRKPLWYIYVFCWNNILMMMMMKMTTKTWWW